MEDEIEIAKMAARQLRDLADQLEEGKLAIVGWRIDMETGQLVPPFFLGATNTRITIKVKDPDG
jgi:hypothetical protein